MSLNKRKVVAYDDIEESADAKRVRYEGYNYGTQQQAPTVGPDERDDLAERSDGEIEESEEQVAEQASSTEPAASTRGHTQEQRTGQGRQGNRGKWSDPTTGMRAFIPGLDEDGEQDDEDEETVDALAYLRSVRSEASGIPDLLTAPRDEVTSGGATFEDETYASSHGYYEDGAYVCAPTMGPTLPLLKPTTISAQEAQHRRLLAQFTSLRCILHTRPAPSTSTAHSTTTSYPAADAAAKYWLPTLRNVDPRPRQLASMETTTVLRLLRLCQGLLRRHSNISTRLGAWLWSLLARLPDVGTLGSDEVSVVRDLGKRAVWVHLGWQDATIAAATAEQYDDAKEAGEVQEKALATPDENTRATLDMILTVAGEVYGQRDLLEFREHWGVDEDASS